MRRHLIGILAIVLLLAAVVLSLWPPDGNGYQQFLAASWRLGALLAVLWLAWPDARHTPIWVWFTIPALVAILALKPKWFLFALPIVIVLLIIRPRNRQRR